MLDLTKAPLRSTPDAGEILLDSNLPADAVPFFLARLKADPDNWKVLCNLGSAYTAIGSFPDAINAFERALALAPMEWLVHYNLGNLREAMGDFEEAFYHRRDAWEFMRQGQRKVQDFQQVAFALSISALRAGQWNEDSWALYRWGLYNHSWQPPPGIKPWRGEDLKGKRLLVLREGGYGDTFCCLRFLEPLKRMGAEVTLYVWDRQIPAIEQCPWVDRWVLASGSIDTREHDFATGIMQLPGIFGVTPETLPPPFPLRFEGLDPTRNGKPLLGLCWYAEENGQPRKTRSIPDEEAEALGQVNADWFTLVPGRRLSFTQSPLHTDWFSTARLIQSLDAVVTVDTAMLHLAGSMGKPTIALLPVNSDWRWMDHGDTTPWYPSVRLVRSHDPLSFKGALEEVRKLLDDVH